MKSRLNRKVLSLLIAGVMVLTLIPAGAFAADTGSVRVKVTVENTTFSTDQGAPWSGKLFEDVEVTVSRGQNLCDAVKAACEVKNMDIKAGNYGYGEYISGIEGLGETTGGGFMASLNGTFPDVGSSYFTVGGKPGLDLKNGDKIDVMYTVDFGPDLGYYWSITDKRLKALKSSKGSLSPAFSAGRSAYTLIAPAGTTSLKITPLVKNSNNFIPLVSLDGGKTWKNTCDSLSVKNGSVITVMSGTRGDAYPEVGYGEPSPKTYKITVALKPAKPRSVRATVKSMSSIKVSWKKAAQARGYEIYRATKKNGTYKKVRTVSDANTLSWTNKQLTRDKKYYYKVRAYRTISGKKVYGSFSGKAAGRTKVISFSLKKSSNTITCRWRGVKGADGYQIRRAMNSGKFKHIRTAKSWSRSYKSLWLQKGKTYKYRMRTFEIKKGKRVYSSWSEVKKIKL